MSKQTPKQQSLCNNKFDGLMNAKYSIKQQYQNKLRWLFHRDAMKMIATHSLEVCHNRNISDWATIKSTIKGDLSQFLFKNTKRNPMILPVIMEI